MPGKNIRIQAVINRKKIREKDIHKYDELSTLPGYYELIC
jgi:hypothetical protein